MAWDSQTIDELNSINEVLESGADKERMAKYRSTGRLSARERLTLLFDGNFEEICKYSKPRYNNEIGKQGNWGDGVISAIGYTNGIRLCAVSQDANIRGGSGGEIHVAKICEALEKAIELKCPIVYLFDSGGARIEEGILSLSSYSRLFKLNVEASGYIPQIAAIMGTCAGGSSYSPALCDFVFMIKDRSQFFITGPKVIRALTGESVTMNELGGTEVHSKVSGQVNYLCSDDKDCIDQIKRLLSYLCETEIPFSSGRTDYKKRGLSIENIIPENTRHPYDARKIINNIVDSGSFMELSGQFARNLVTGFARIDGKTVGIVANQPQSLGGALNCDASDKCARFVRSCDCFDIPVITFVDVPGFYPGSAEEKKGILRHGSKILYAYSEATVPKISVIMRKAYGGAYCAMNSKALGADYVLAWPISEIAVMGADGAVDVIYRREIEMADNPDEARNEKIRQYEEKYLNPFFAASYGFVDEIIMPQDTRGRLINLISVFANKTSREHIEKKHGNIPL